MAKESNKVVKTEDALEVQEAVNNAGQWIIRNQKLLVYGIIVVLALVVAFILYNQHLQTKAVEASNELYKAELYMLNGNYEVALNGEEAEDITGFAELADEYGKTQPGKLAALYAGICYYNLGQYDEAVEYLKKFDADDVNISVAAKLKLGDAYANLGETEKAINTFMSAAKSNNKVLAPIALKKAGIAYLELGDNAHAREAFEQIKEKYPTSQEARDIDKYIAIAQ